MNKKYICNQAYEECVECYHAEPHNRLNACDIPYCYHFETIVKCVPVGVTINLKKSPKRLDLRKRLFEILPPAYDEEVTEIIKLIHNNYRRRVK